VALARCISLQGLPGNFLRTIRAVPPTYHPHLEPQSLSGHRDKEAFFAIEFGPFAVA
jgi:hypothetical protein